MIFKPVWITSIAHLEALSRIHRETPLWRELLGLYRLPPGFPYVQASLGFSPFDKVPQIALRSGEIHLGNGRVTFAGRPFRIPLFRVFNIPPDGTFSLRFDELTAVERFDFILPVSRYFTFPFVRLRSTRSGELADFLLCAGGYAFQMRRIQKRSLMLLDALQRAAAGGSAPFGTSWG